MAALVVKSWRVDTKPIDKHNNYVDIQARHSGLWAWLLSLLGVDPTIHLLVGLERIEFSSTSLAGTHVLMTPLECISHSYYGYFKPWAAAVRIIVFWVVVAGLVASGVSKDYGQGAGFGWGLGLALFGCLLALVKYLFDRTLTIGFTEHSGAHSVIHVKPSIIEGVDVNQAQAKKVCVIIQRLIETKQRRVLGPTV